MITFWLVAVVMILVSLAIVIIPLLRQHQLAEMNVAQQNVAIARERLQELAVERDSGELSEEQYEKARLDLEQSLLNDIQTDTPVQIQQGDIKLNRYVATGLLVIIPVAAMLLYFQLGSPDIAQQVLDGKGRAGTSAANPHSGGSEVPSVEEMVTKLEQRLQQNPGDAEGWFMLGRTYMAMGNYEKAIPVLEKVYQMVGEHPGVMLRLADALAMQQGNGITGRTFELVKRSLELAPQDPTALWLGGMGYAQQGDHRQAIGLWRKLEALLKDDENSLREVRSLIAKSEQALGESVPATVGEPDKPAVGVASIEVTVEVDASVKASISPGDTVFIFARAVNGPPMPLAIVSKKAGDLPVKVTLDDSMAMTPTMKLSSFKQVEVLARVSKSGNAMPQPGDLESNKQVISTDKAASVALTINQLIQ